MKKPFENETISQATTILTSLLDVAPEEVDVERRGESGRTNVDLDALIRAGARRFALKWKSEGSPAAVMAGMNQFDLFRKALPSDAIPIIAVPHMRNSGKRMLEEARISWLDLSGNAHIKADELLIHVEGKPNRFKSRGRPSSAFSPKASRVARCLLVQYPDFTSQTDISELIGISKPYISRIVSRLEGDGLVERDRDGAVRVKDPDLMLEAWRDRYEFSKHRIIRGHIPARSGDQLALKVGRTLRQAGIRCVATGLGAAWILTRFASFRTATFYVDEPFPEEAFDKLGFRQLERGANVWLVQPNDQGVFHGSATRRKVDLVHPVQIYLDLKGHPERSEEAAEHLRREFIQWGRLRLFTWSMDEG